MRHPILTVAVAVRAAAIIHGPFTLHSFGGRSDRGEGVISTAVAVLVVAFLGTLMWFGFKTTFTHAQSKTDTQVELIGN